MAQLLSFSCRVRRFASTYARRHSLAEGNRARENRAATIIQSSFRGSRVRAYIRRLHQRAGVIQRAWRGFAARARLRRALKEGYTRMKMETYQEMALRIQRRWRGFCVRKYVHNFYARKRFLQELPLLNQLRRSELQEGQRLQRRETEVLRKAEARRHQLYRAHRLHHLLSTKQCPGVFNSPFRPEPHETELLLRRVRYQARDRTRLSAMVVQMTLSPTRGSCDASHLKLPPILSRNLQGAAAEPEEVCGPAPLDSGPGPLTPARENRRSTAGAGRPPDRDPGRGPVRGKPCQAKP
ncbi:LOW QUALITY PROTEIN: spermatogenesis-associated protein 17-like [Synchiropus picturatus]